MCRSISAFSIQMCFICKSNSFALITKVCWCVFCHRWTSILPGWAYGPSASYSPTRNSMGSKVGHWVIPMLKVGITVEMFCRNVHLANSSQLVCISAYVILKIWKYFSNIYFDSQIYILGKNKHTYAGRIFWKHLDLQMRCILYVLSDHSLSHRLGMLWYL